MQNDIRKCHRGHLKVLRRYGWYCEACERINRHARAEKEYAAIDRPKKPKGVRNVSRSTPVDQLCKRGHQRVRRPSGRLACAVCQNAYSMARRRLERSRSCEHVDGENFTGILSSTGHMVCVDCVVAEANAA